MPKLPTSVSVTVEETEITLLRPSTKKAVHSKNEWLHELHRREREQAARDKAATDKLNDFSVRYVTEAVFGEEMAHRLLGESGGEMPLRELPMNPKDAQKVINTENAKHGHEVLPYEKGSTRAIMDESERAAQDEFETVQKDGAGRMYGSGATHTLERPDPDMAKLTTTQKTKLLKALLNSMDEDELTKLLG